MNVALGNAGKFIALQLVASAAIFASGCNGSSSASAPVPQVATPTANQQQDAGGAGPAACSPPPPSPPSATLTSADPKCQSATACTPANPSLLVNLQNGALTGTQNVTLTWNLVAYDQNSTTRNVAIILSGLPTAAVVTPTFGLGAVTKNVTVSWTPDAAQTGTVSIILRDYDRCLVTETVAANCVNSQLNPNYDKQLPPTPYVIATQPGSGIVCPKQSFFSGVLGPKPPGC